EQTFGKTGRRSRRSESGSASGPSNFLVDALIVFLALEYLRPPMLQPLQIQTLFLIGLPIAWLASKDRPWSRGLSLQFIYVVVGALSLPFAHNYFVVYLDARQMVGYLITALAVTWLLAWRKPFQRVMWIWVGIMCFQALWAITHSGRGYGSFLGDENDLAIACDMAVPFPFLAAQSLRGWKRWTCGFALLVLLVGIVASWSRGGFLGLIGAILYCLL